MTVIVLIMAGYALSEAETMVAKITAINGDTVTLDAGTGQGLTVGLKGRLYYEIVMREEIIRIYIANINVTAVESNRCYAKIGEKTAEVKLGYLAEIEGIQTGKGFIYIASTPEGAEILLNGQATGQKTPATMEVAAGSHIVETHLQGYEDASKSVKVSTKKVSRVSLQLVRGSATLTILTEPPMAKVYLDGELKGDSPLTIEDISAGKHTLELRKDGYVVHTEIIDLSSDDPVVLERTLRKIIHDLQIVPQKIHLDDAQNPTKGNVADLSGSSWPQFKGNAARWGSSASSFDSVPSKVWEAPIGDLWWSVSPVADGNNVYANGKAISIRHGKIMWSMGDFDTKGRVSATPVVLDSGVCFFAGIQVGFFSHNGILRWKRVSGGLIDCGGVSWDNRVVFKSRDKYIYCVDADTGELIWRLQDGKATEFAFGSRSLFYTGMWKDKALIRLDARDGAIVWLSPGQSSSSSAFPIVYGEMVFAASSSNLDACRMDSGAMLWSHKAEDFGVPLPQKGTSLSHNFNDAVVLGKGALVVCLDSTDMVGEILMKPVWNAGTVVCIEPSTGHLFWKYRLADGYHYAKYLVATRSEILVFMQPFWRREDIPIKILALDSSSGSIRWEMDIPGSLSCRPIVSAKTLLIVNNGTLEAYR